MISPITTGSAPPPAGTYSQGIMAQGRLVFISGQTPRRADGTRLGQVPFAEQAQQALANLEAVAQAAGLSLATHAAKVTVYLKHLADRTEFDTIYATFVGDTPPTRTIVQSNFEGFDIEVDAILIA